MPAPKGAVVGQGGEGLGAVAWLKLVANDGETTGLKEAYRVNTAGGMQPTTCAGMPATFQVEYSAECVLPSIKIYTRTSTNIDSRYWFYES